MDTMQYTHLYRSPLGTITLAADSEGLTGLWFEGQKYFADARRPARRDDAADIRADPPLAGQLFRRE